jgi:hypothetical protein
MVVTDAVTFRNPIDEADDFESQAAEIAQQIEEIRLNFHSQLNSSGISGFIDIFEQIGLSSDRPSWLWLMNLQIFNLDE